MINKYKCKRLTYILSHKRNIHTYTHARVRTHTLFHVFLDIALKMCGDAFGRHSLGENVLLASKRPEMLLNTPQCTGQLSQQRITRPKKLIVLIMRNPDVASLDRGLQ